MPRQIFRTCCCCDLRTGVILIALFSMGISAINIYTGVNAVLELKHLRPRIEEKDIQHQLPIPWKYYDDTINLGWSNIAFFASDLIISVLVLIGALQRNTCLLTTWMVWTLVCVMYHLSVSIFFLSIWRGFQMKSCLVLVAMFIGTDVRIFTCIREVSIGLKLGMVVGNYGFVSSFDLPTFGYTMIIDLIIVVYFLLVVYSFKQEIINQRANPTIPVVMASGQPAPGYVYPPAGPQPYPQAAPPPYMYTTGNQQAPPPYTQYTQYTSPTAAEQKVPLE